MAKRDVNPFLRQLVRAVNASGQAAVPVTVTVHGTMLTGTLVAQSRYFSELVEGNPLMSALEPASGLLGTEYAKEAEAESDHHLHVRAARYPRRRRSRRGPVAHQLGGRRRVDPARQRRGERGGQGPFARLLGTP